MKAITNPASAAITPPPAPDFSEDRQSKARGFATLGASPEGLDRSDLAMVAAFEMAAWGKLLRQQGRDLDGDLLLGIGLRVEQLGEVVQAAVGDAADPTSDIRKRLYGMEG